MESYIKDLALFDIQGAEAVAADLGRCNTPVQVTAYEGSTQLQAALEGSHLVIVAAGVPPQPGMSRAELFSVNAGIVKALAGGVAAYCPQAIVLIVTNPINSTVPAMAEALKAAGAYDPRRLLGVTTLDVVTANTTMARAFGLDVRTVDVPVVGGHSGATMLPLLSQAVPPLQLAESHRAALTRAIREAGGEVVDKGGSALSAAYAAARMAESALAGLAGEAGVFECAFVESDLVPGCRFFASGVELGPGGVARTLGLSGLHASERRALDALLPELQADIQKGIDFVHSPVAAAAHSRR